MLLLVGCTKPQAESGSQPTPKKKPLENLSLRLAVVDDPAIAAAVVRLRGEWNVQTGAELQVSEITEKDLARPDLPPFDAVIAPSHWLSVLAERGQLAPAPGRLLRGVQWAELFELLKLREAVWGQQAMAVPFGSPVFCCWYRADLLEKLGRRPPRTWPEYYDLARKLARLSPPPKRDGAAWAGTIEPLAPGWAGLTLLARAAPYAKHRDNYSALFDIDTMEPMIAGPPFVQALEELVAASKFGPADPLRFDPASARTAFWRGQCGMMLGWPTAAEERGEGRVTKDRESTTASIRVGFVQLPGSPRVFNLTGHVWDRRAEGEDTRVPLLAATGRLGMVAKQSAHTDAAFQLLFWLTDDRIGPQVCAVSPQTTLFCQANLKTPSLWVEKNVPLPAALQYADATDAAFRHEQWLGALRLPGRAEYLAALDEAVAAAVRGQTTPLQALMDVDRTWRGITDRLGLDRQRAAYRHSLGLE
ncbi:MAG: extracellular solute-binding protein [Thermoguttaceae bacterium]